MGHLQPIARQRWATGLCGEHNQGPSSVAYDGVRRLCVCVCSDETLWGTPRSTAATTHNVIYTHHPCVTYSRTTVPYHDFIYSTLASTVSTLKCSREMHRVAERNWWQRSFESCRRAPFLGVPHPLPPRPPDPPRPAPPRRITVRRKQKQAPVSRTRHRV